MKYIYLIIVAILLSAPLFSAPDLTLWIRAGEKSGLENTRQIIDDFEQETGLTVVIKEIPAADEYDIINEELANPSGANIIQLDAGWIPFFMKMRYLADLTYFENSIRTYRFPDNILEACRIGENRRIYAVPWSMNVRLLYLNKKFTSQIEASAGNVKTYEGFRDYLIKIKEAGFTNSGSVNVAPFGFPGGRDWNVVSGFTPWIWSEGGSYIVRKDSGWTSNLLNHNTIMGIYRYLYFAREKLHSPGAIKKNSDTIINLFLDEEYAGIVAGADLISKLSAPGTEGGYGDSKLAASGFYALPIPAGTMGSTSLLTVNTLAVPKKYANDENTLRLLFYLTGSKSLDRYCRKIGLLPPDKTLWPSWTEDTRYTGAFEAASTGKIFLNETSRAEIDRVLNNTFRKIWSMFETNDYSDDQLYTLLVAGDREIKRILKTPGQNPSLSKESFFSIITEYKHESQPRYESPLSNPKLLITLLSILGGFLLLAIGILLYTRGRKSDHD